MKRSVVIGVAFTFLLFILSAWLSGMKEAPSPVYIPPSGQRSGDPGLGYRYVVEGDYLKSGIPYDLYLMAYGKDKKHYLQRDSLNENIPYNFTAVKASNGVVVVVPNCLQCHAQVFGDKLIVGLGSTDVDFTHNERSGVTAMRNWLKTFSGGHSGKYEAAADFIKVTSAVAPGLVTHVRGVNAADRLAALLAAHRDPVTLRWKDTPALEIPDAVIPTDVPAWWLLKKKHAMFYNGFGRGDFGKFLMASNLLTVTDTAEANVVDRNIPNVLSWLLTLEPPKYPYPVDKPKATRGKYLFETYCENCHGSYGPQGGYPNLLIPEAIVGTDSLLYASNFQYPQFIDWFNNSWFSSGPYPAQLTPFNGYIAPPLDGIWITAPYFHNGSVPTLEAVLNSKERPVYWNRYQGNKTVYDYDAVGFRYTTPDKPGGSSVYNTTLPGYGNYGHTFGDELTAGERKDLIEYLKTL
ncbi:MAG TPA: hypothetical protein VL547_13820 [Dinghuibacter sp.]|uniref:c-type cytochrome n=1 Tax=Dinghuibacter sp. TaxID=2024697 RepID=UPI002B940A4C|nr:hypothetical protein [Dinghuibacter sp.]HTJ13106.1 hypothetical protein [Dinghuibacter sp.]